MRAIVLAGLDFGHGDLPTIELIDRILRIGVDALWVLLPPVIAAALCGALGMFLHVGAALSFEPVTPKPEKVDPAAGLKRIFSLDSVTELLETTLKAVILAALLWYFIKSLLPLIAASAYQSVAAIGSLSWAAITKVLGAALLLFLILAPMDFGLKTWLFLRNQRMSKQDQKDEYKQLEGDPHVKWARKNLAQELSNSDPRERVAGADAVIANPTHYAVALRYRPDEAGLPIVVAKGVDEAALQIRRCAEELRVPVFVNPPLARALHQVPLNGHCPEPLFEAVAVILRWVDEVGAQREDPQRTAS
jgi:type III secretion protein U